MPFASYMSVEDVARRHQIHFRRATFIRPVAATLGDYFRSELAFTLAEVPFDRSEPAACETLIYPLLREVWKPFSASLTLWSHEPIAYDDDLCGVPDYIVARRSPLGPIIFDRPYLLVVEAKKDDFPRGWGQCLAAMLAAQKLNDQPDKTHYGVSTNGLVWQFGELTGDVFSQEPRPFTLQDVDGLAAALNSVMKNCHDAAIGYPAAV